MTTPASSFYVTSGTLRPDAASYVERQADTDLCDALRRGEYCYVLTSRQMGKSSLMVHTAARLRREGVAVVVLDLTRVGQHLSPEQWYDGLLEHLGRQLGLEEELEEHWLRHARHSPLQRWMSALREIVLGRTTQRIVIFIDEVDAVLGLRFSTDEFFAAIRELYNRRAEDPELARLAFCLLGVASPADLITDARTSPFNVGRRIELTDFSEAEAAPLAAGLTSPPAPPRNGEGSLPVPGRPPATKRSIPPPRFGEESGSAPGDPPATERLTPPPRFGEGVGGRGQSLLRRVLYWTGGQPYLTQRLCRAVAEDPRATSPADVDRLCDGLFLSRKAREVDDNLAFVRNRILRAEVDLASLLERYRQVQRGRRVADDETDLLVTVLRLSGVVRSAGGALRVRNRIYGRVFDPAWVLAHMPGAELRRQRAAYRRGLARASAIAGVVLVLMGALAVTALSQAARARRGERLARLQTERANEKTGEARQLAERLQVALREKERTFGRLRASLAAEQTQRHRATEAATAAQVAQHRERDQFLQANAARQEEQRQRRVAEAQRERALQARAEAIAQRQLAEQEAGRARRNLYFANMNLAPQDWEGHNIVGLRRLLSETRENGGRGFEWAYWHRLAHPERLTLQGHHAPVLGIACSPDGKRIVTGGADRMARVSDAETGRELLTLKGHGGIVTAVAYSPTGTRIATGSEDFSARLWDARTGREAMTLRGHPGGVLCVAYSSDGGRIVTGGVDETARVWDTATGREIVALRGHNDQVISVAFSPDGRRIATASEDFSARLWDAGTGQQIGTLDLAATPYSLAFSPDGHRLLLGTGSSTVNDRGNPRAAGIWDAESGRRLVLMQGHTESVLAVAFSPDGTKALTGSEDHTARLWDVATGREIRTFWGHAGAVCAVAFTPDGTRLLTASWDQTAKIWSATGAGETFTLRGHPSAVRAVAFSPDGRILVAARRGDNTVARWDTATGTPLRALQGPVAPVWSIAVSPDGRQIAAVCLDHTARLWDAATGRLMGTLRGHRGWVTSPVFSPDGRRLVTAARDQTVRVWDAATGRPRSSVSGPDTVADSVILSPDGRRVLTVGFAGTAVVWDAVTGRERGLLQGHADAIVAAAFSPDSRRILTGSRDQTAKLWDAETGRALLSLQGHIGAVQAVAFSPDGRRIVTGGLDQTARVWDTATGRETLTLRGYPAPVTCVAFSPDSTRIVAGSDDGTVTFREAAPAAQVTAWIAAERAAERAARERAARQAARDALQVVASSDGAGAIRLQWRPAPHAAGYYLYRGPAGAPAARLTRLTPAPLTGTAFIDRRPGLVEGRPVTYAVMPLVRRAGGVAAGLAAMLQALPVATPPGWSGSSLNEGARSGSVRVDPVSGRITLRGSGDRIGGAADACYFFSRKVTGDFQIMVKLLTAPARAGSKAGLMMRDSLDPGARRVAFFALSDTDIRQQMRPRADGDTSVQTALGRAQFRLPILLRLIRRGDWYGLDYSLDGGAHFAGNGNGPVVPSFPQTLEVGLAISSESEGEVTEATFSDLTLEAPPAGARR